MLQYIGDQDVTPRVGVWIETAILQAAYRPSAVTPRVGVWIETEDKKRGSAGPEGHSPRGSVD